MPFVEDFGAFGDVATGANAEGNAFVVEGDAGFGILIDDGEEIASSPERVAFAIDELPGCFSGLIEKLLLLTANPSELANGIGSGYV